MATLKSYCSRNGAGEGVKPDTLVGLNRYRTTSQLRRVTARFVDRDKYLGITAVGLPGSRRVYAEYPQTISDRLPIGAAKRKRRCIPRILQSAAHESGRTLVNQECAMSTARRSRRGPPLAARAAPPAAALKCPEHLAWEVVRRRAEYVASPCDAVELSTKPHRVELRGGTADPRWGLWFRRRPTKRR